MPHPDSEDALEQATLALFARQTVNASDDLKRGASFKRRSPKKGWRSSTCQAAPVLKTGAVST